MTDKTFTITLADGTQLTGLELNSNNFVSSKEVTEDTFRGKLSKVTITGDTEADDYGLIGEHKHMELISVAHYTQAVHGCKDGYYFVLRDIPHTELERLQTRGDIDYLAMMTGINL